MDNILDFYLSKQIRYVDYHYRFEKSDLKRFIQRVNYKSIFGDECVRSSCYIHIRKNKKQYYVFYLKGKKVLLHRILYMNFKGLLYPDEYIRHSCKNNLCLNLNHFLVFKKKEHPVKSKNNVSKVEKYEIDFQTPKPTDINEFGNVELVVDIT